jgi:hypothetical protein
VASYGAFYLITSKALLAQAAHNNAHQYFSYSEISPKASKVALSDLSKSGGRDKLPFATCNATTVHRRSTDAHETQARFTLEARSCEEQNFNQWEA